MKNKKLIFVYNADSGFSSALDSIRKVVSPSTYKCNLCKLTYGVLNMKKDWKEFIEKSGYELEFLHKDEFVKKFDIEAGFPAVFLEGKEKIRVLIDKEEINLCKNLEELKELILRSTKYSRPTKSFSDSLLLR